MEPTPSPEQDQPSGHEPRPPHLQPTVKKDWGASPQGPTDPTKVVHEDRLFGKILVNLKLATAEQVKSTLDDQARLSSTGQVKRLGQILFEQSAVGLEDVETVLRLQGKVPMLCPECRKVYNVKGYESGKAVKCPKCGTGLYVPGLDGLIC